MYFDHIHVVIGEWGKRPRCGSVVTCVVNGRSVYAVVDRFLTVDGDGGGGFASVRWFSEPVYPFGSPLVVRVGCDGSILDSEVGSIVRLEDIDPSCVVVEPHHDHFFMMRQSGYDILM